MQRTLGMTTLALFLTVACGGGRDIDVQQMADGALDSVALGDKVDAHYDRDDKVVRLSGTVATATERDNAAQAVEKSVGPHAQVANEIVVEGPHADAADDMDDGIEERFENLLANTENLKNLDVDVRVENGVVTLSGDVPSEQDRASIEGMARAIPGVRDIVNSLKVNADAARARRQ
ncbi:MAG: BON domain-containing protein [Acidobacteria bacterium]|nr:BON domain-containing protein [Acidobacteriota bacterium]